MGGSLTGWRCPAGWLAGSHAARLPDYKAGGWRIDCLARWLACCELGCLAKAGGPLTDCPAGWPRRPNRTASAHSGPQVS